MNTTIKINALTFAYDKKDILKDVAFTVEKGQFVSIIGPNGSGKTTLLKHISKLITPPLKNVYVNGQDVAQQTPKALAKQLSLLPQQSNLEYGFSCFDSVMMGRHPHIDNFRGETKKDIDLVKNVMEQTNTYQFKDRPITELSGGERQRVVLARTIVQDADIMLLDEPITFLDIHHQIDIVKRIKAYSTKNNKTVIAVLHDLNFALKFSDIIVLLHEGSVISMGSPKEVLTKENLKKAYGIDVEIIEKNNTISYIMPIF